MTKQAGFKNYLFNQPMILPLSFEELIAIKHPPGVIQQLQLMRLKTAATAH
jgi:hypothetical protein